MRSRFVSALAAAACILIGCDIQPTLPVKLPAQPDQPDSVPKQVQELLEKHCITDQTISESMDQDQTGGLWPPVPDTSYSAYVVTFIWGHLLSVRMPPFPVVDWSGELSVSSADGLVKVIRTIDFENGEDYLIPVTDPVDAAWVSKTAGDFDGLGLLIRIPQPSAVDARTPDLTFKTNPLCITLPFSRLDHFVEYYPVSGTEGVAVLARRVDGIACPRGFIKGEWAPQANDGSCGLLSGMWYDLFGIPVGSMAGLFWTSTDGTRRFEGWLSGVYLTVVLAEFEGTWYYDDPRLCATCGQGHGRFEGTFRYLNSNRTGVMRGEFGDVTLPRGEHGMPLAGIWRVDCPIITGESSGTDE